MYQLSRVNLGQAARDIYYRSTSTPIYNISVRTAGSKNGQSAYQLRYRVIGTNGHSLLSRDAIPNTYTRSGKNEDTKSKTVNSVLDASIRFYSSNNTIILPWTGWQEAGTFRRNVVEREFQGEKEVHRVISRYRNGALHRDRSYFLVRVNHRDIFLSRGAIATRVQSISSVFGEIAKSASPDMLVEP